MKNQYSNVENKNPIKPLHNKYVSQSLTSTISVAILTSIHHTYEIGFYAVIPALLFIVAPTLLVRWFRFTGNKIYLWVYGLLITWLVVGFGIFDGLWNHTIKIIGFQIQSLLSLHGGVMKTVGEALKGNLIYEATGVLTFVASMLVAYYGYKFIQINRYLRITGMQEININNDKNNMKKINLFIVLTIAFGLTACYNETTEKQFETIFVKQRSLSSTVLATGVIKPKVGAEVRVGSRVSGVVKKLNVHVGDIVKKGDLLARLDDTEFTAQYNQVAANLENAKTTLKYARIEKDRQEALLKTNAVSQQNCDLAVKAFEVAVAQLAQVTASLDYAKIQLDYTRIVAPIDGAVASVSTQEGETVAAIFTSPTFLTIIDLKRLEVRAYVDETDISKVREGQMAEFTVDTYPGIIFIGSVMAIYPNAEIIDNVVNYVVIIGIADSKGKTLRPEMTATVNIIDKSLEDVIAIPGKAITHQNGDDIVYVLNNGKPEERKVITGIKSKSFIQIVEGLAENEKLILNK